LPEGYAASLGSWEAVVTCDALAERASACGSNESLVAVHGLRS